MLAAVCCKRLAVDAECKMRMPNGRFWRFALVQSAFAFRPAFYGPAWAGRRSWARSPPGGPTQFKPSTRLPSLDTICRQSAMTRHRRLLLALLILAVGFAAASVRLRVRAADEHLPARLTDGEFWRLTEDLSEPNGYFRSDNLLSNEVYFQYVVKELIQRAEPAGT